MWRVRGGAPGCSGAPPPSTENAVAARLGEERVGRVRRSTSKVSGLEGPGGMVSGAGGEALIPSKLRPVNMGRYRVVDRRCNH